MFTPTRPTHLATLYVPPAWVNVTYNDDSTAACEALGTDAAGRQQRLYSAEHHALAKSAKFGRVRNLLTEEADIRTQLESDINDATVTGTTREAALVAYLVFETGIRPGSNSDTLAAVQAYGATTLQLRHVKPCPRGCRLQFTGKKGVAQNVLVTNPYLVSELLRRKAATTKYTTTLFRVSSTTLNVYIGGLGSGNYSAKDFRTLRGTSLALSILGPRKRLPKAISKRKRLVNATLDKVAAKLGNTRAVSRGSYVDPVIIETILNGRTLPSI